MAEREIAVRSSSPKRHPSPSSELHPDPVEPVTATVRASFNAMRPVLIVCLTGALLVVSLVRALAACSTCSDAPSAEQLPEILCTPLPPGAEGCIGLPGEEVGPGTPTYPVLCHVRVAAEEFTCGFRDSFCFAGSNVPGGPKQYLWVTPQ